ncbi:hypothetical protein ACLMJK_008041 [Lecanora helva]
MTKRDPSTTKHVSEKTKKGGSRLHDRIMGGPEAPSRKAHPPLRTGTKDLLAKNSSIVAGNGTFFSDSPDEASPADAARGTFPDYRSDRSWQDTNKGSIPSVSRRPPSREAPNADIAPWMDENLPSLSTHGFTSNNLFNDAPPNLQLSPAFRPDTGGSDSPDPNFRNDERRPSIATSITTESSQTSVSKPSTSRGTPYKKVAGFFSDDGRQSSRSSDVSIPNMLQREQTASSSRHGSIHTSRDEGRPPTSPINSRPRTPLPSSEVTPWLFQDFKDLSQYGDVPVRQAPAGPDKQRYAEIENPTPAHNHHHHRIHLPHHRHNRSREEAPKPPPKDPGNGHPPRPLANRQDSNNIRTLKDSISSPMASRNTLPIRGLSPTPTSNNAVNRSETMPGQRSPAYNSSGGKRSLLDKLRRHKGEHGGPEPLHNLTGSTTSLHHSSTKDERNYKSDLTSSKDASRSGSVATFASDSTAKASDYSVGDSAYGVSPISKKESGSSKLLHSHGKFPIKPKRGHSYDSEKGRNASVTSDSLFSLDTNLDDMTGIVDPNAMGTMRGGPHGGIFTGDPIPEEPYKECLKDFDAPNGPGAWDAPDSWIVNKPGDDVVGRLGEIDETGIPQKVEDDGTPHCVRIFRIDSTFATLSMGVNTTASEILQILGKKSFLQDDLNNYQIIIKKHDLHRQLAPGERPIAIQKKLLEQAGYHNSDRIDEIGREDNSYLCRFTFVPTKLSGYYSLEKEPGQGKLQKFSHIDLQGRSLVTIPITLYQKATEIVSINLSRNLALDVPKDFIQSCNNLRDVRYISNEAWQLPASLSLATGLRTLDISNNRLEQLEHAELDKLPNLVSIKMSNNKLRHLPEYFGQFQQLRSLNLSSNYMEAFPDFLCDLKSLIDLDISFNTIRTLPKIGQLTRLEKLWATNNMLSGSFPEDFGNLTNLKEVDVRFNGITNIDIFIELPNIEQIMAGHNVISKFEGSFGKIRIFHLDHNPMTRFDFKAPVLSLSSLNIASCKISRLDDSIFERMRNVSKVILDKNHFSTLSPQIGRLQKLEHLSIARNPLSSLPPTIGRLQLLHYLDIRECNLKRLPSEIWFCSTLEDLNVSSNVLENFPKPATTLPASQPETEVNSAHESAETTPVPASTPENEEVGRLEDFRDRRPSQASGGLLSVGSSPASNTRNDSIVSVYGPGGRKASVVSRTQTNGAPTPVTRKDSSLQHRANTFASSLKNLSLADNRLSDDVFDEITMLPELRILNLSYNELYDVPSRSIKRWQNLTELYLSGNELTSLPSDDLEEVSALKVLHLNGNKFQVLPAELGKVRRLTVLDVGSNSLRYNVSNWPYDWNWNWNKNLKYLNFSGNKRLEIKPSRSYQTGGGRDSADLTNFTTLHHLRVLGLMDVTLTIPSIPDQTEDRRVRTSGSLAGALAYGMADTLGKHEHLSTIDMVVPRFRGHESETLLGMFDGQTLSSGGSRVAKYLLENFQFHFTEELSKLKNDEDPGDGLRRTFLALNKDLASSADRTLDEKEHRVPQKLHRGSTTGQTLSADDLNSGGVATVMFLDSMELYVANVGDAQAMLMQSDGGHKILTRKHEPADRRERERIREAGGYVSRQGKLNEVLEVSRAFGYVQMMPAVMAAPNVNHVTLKESDEMILIASKELWDFLSLEMVVDVARSERGDLMRAAQKLRDLAMAFGATGKIMVQMIGISDLKRRERNRKASQSLSMGPSQMRDDLIFPIKRGKKRDRPDDSTLQRLDPEVEAPTGDLSMVFTDIKNSTTLWEKYPLAMQSAIKSHNEVMRRQLRVIGGYEVKTEGDAFMVSFSTATAALLWCFVVQQHLLEIEWPPEILNTVHCAEVRDADDQLIYRGLSVRMGIHWGNPVCEPDPITRRMDYFGPMVNRAARISGAADGGQIYVSADYITEIQRSLEAFADPERSGSTASEVSLTEDSVNEAIRRELRALSSQGFEVKDLGAQKLKGLENPELIFQTYPHALAGRLIAQQQRTDAEAAAASNEPASLQPNSTLEFDTEYLWALWNISLRLEMLCSALESPGTKALRPPEKSVLERMKNRGGEVTDRFLVSFLEHQVVRIEVILHPALPQLLQSMLIRNIDMYINARSTKYGAAVQQTQSVGECLSHG